MSYKIYCDVCNSLMKEQTDRFRRGLGDVKVEVMVAFKNVWNAGHLCEPCLLKVITEGHSLSKNDSYIDALTRDKVA